MMQYKILVVDDDPNIREVLTVLLGSEGYVVDQAENGEIALEKIKENKQVDLVILDIMMPGMSGVEVCAKIRETSSVPVLFLTAKSQEQDKVEAYSEGGDDYLVKPFSQTELLMKVKSLLRRYKEYYSRFPLATEETLIGGGISIDSKSRAAIRGDKKIPLTDKEYDILRYFIEHRGEIVENKVLNLRKKLEEDVNKPKIIKTVWGKGYKVE